MNKKTYATFVVSVPKSFVVSSKNHPFLAKYPEWHEQPLLLSKEEMDQPHVVLSEFFDCYNLRDIRFFLKEWLREALRPNEILEMDYLTLHDHILKLTEAAWLLHKSKKRKEKKRK